jgi:hypothetical protein
VSYFADLSAYSYWPNNSEVALNVGWLDAEHEFTVGTVHADVVPAVLRLVLREPVHRTRGWHRCNLCVEPAYPVCMTVDGIELALGNGEIRLVGQGGRVYAAPSLIAHYLSSHSYLPPVDFMAGLLGNADRSSRES